jgi:hypothetical protein
MGSGEKDSLAPESFKMPEGVIDQIISQQNTLVPAKDIVCGRDEGKVAS